MKESPIYLDNSSTIFPKPLCVLHAITHYLTFIGASPGRSTHRLSLKAHDIVSDTKTLLASLFNAQFPYQIALTPNATFALNTVIKGVLSHGNRVITTTLEHNSVLRPLEGLKKSHSITVSYLPNSPTGTFNLLTAEEELKKGAKLFILNHGSNVLGSISPLAEISALCVKYGCQLLVDAAQTAGLIEIDVQKTPVDYLAFTGHKALLGPSGVGGFYIKDPASIPPLVEGGTGSNSQSLHHPENPDYKFDAGTLNYLGIAGMRSALTYLFENDWKKIALHKTQLANHLYELLSKIPGVSVYGPLLGEPRLPIVSFNIEGFLPSEVAYILDSEFNILIRAGLQCAPLIHSTIGTSNGGVARVSPGYFNTTEQIIGFAKAVQKIAHSAVGPR